MLFELFELEIQFLIFFRVAVHMTQQNEYPINGSFHTAVLNLGKTHMLRLNIIPIFINSEMWSKKRAFEKKYILYKEIRNYCPSNNSNKTTVPSI